MFGIFLVFINIYNICLLFKFNKMFRKKLNENYYDFNILLFWVVFFCGGLSMGSGGYFF